MSETREIRFRIVRGDKVIGYERLTDKGWEWMCPYLNPDLGERWTPGVMQLTYRSEDYKRDQYTGYKDRDNIEIYERDVIQYDYEYDSDYDGDMPIVRRSSGKSTIKDINDTYLIRKAAEESKGCWVVGNAHQNPELL